MLKNKYGRAIAFIILVLALISALYAIQRAAAVKLYDNQLAACHSDNHLRHQINVRAEANRDFISGAITARLASAHTEGGMQKAIDLAAAKRYAKDRKQFTTLPPLDCGKIDAP